MFNIFSIALSKLFAINSCDFAKSSSPSTKIGSHPRPLKYNFNSSLVFLERIVGLEIFPPFK